MPTAAITFDSRFPAVTTAILAAQSRAVAAVGKRIAADARSRMVPGYFYLTGESKRRTRYRQMTPTSGRVRIGTSYASFVEYGTVHMVARPVLRPALAAVWPHMAETARMACRAMEGPHLAQTLPPIPPLGEDAEPGE